NKLFNKMAETTKNVLISDVIVASSNLISAGSTRKIFSNQFDVGFEYRKHSFNFGFIQVCKGKSKKDKNSTTVPIFTIDHRMIKAVPPDIARDLLSGIQKAM